jgi:hypothetical protein
MRAWWKRGPALRSTRRATTGFASSRTRVNSNVGHFDMGEPEAFTLRRPVTGSVGLHMECS